jgi:hypothetical protein
MVGRVRTLDLIWVRNDCLLNECFRVPPFEWFFRDAPIGKLHQVAQSSPDILSEIIDYRKYLRTGGNWTASNTAARIILKKRQLACFENVKQFL